MEDIRRSVRHHVRAMRVAAASSLLVVAAVVAGAVLPGGLVPEAVTDHLPWLVPLGLVLLTAVVVAPWERWLAARPGRLTLFAILAAGMTLVSVVIALAGTAGSELFWLYLPTSVFAAVTYPPGPATAFVTYTAASYLAALGVAGQPVPVGPVVFHLAVLLAAAGTANFLATSLRRSAADAEASHAAAARHARTLTTVAEAARHIAQLDDRAVLEAVADAALALDFDMVGIYAVGTGGQVQLAVVRNAPEALRVGEEELPWVGTALELEDVLILEAPDRDPRLAYAHRRFGVWTAVVAPLIVEGTRAGVMVLGTTRPRRYDDTDRHAVELLSSLASRGLEVARRFAAERELVRHLEEVDRLKTEFLSTVSHELRTPLTVVSGLSDLLGRNWHRLDDHGRAELVGRLQANAASLERTIATLLDAARAQDGRLVADLEPVEVGRLVLAVVDRLAPLLAEHPVSLAVDEQACAAADPLLLERVVENLLTNAARHTPPGTPVEVSVGCVGGGVEVAVRDHGPGIDPEDLPHLGQRFYRGRRGRTRSEGLGLGLALVRDVLALHRTELHIDSRPGAGTTMSFCLPAVPRAAPRA